MNPLALQMLLWAYNTVLPYPHSGDMERDMRDFLWLKGYLDERQRITDKGKCFIRNILDSHTGINI